MLWFTFIDQFGDGPLGHQRWGQEGEVEWKIVEAESEADAVDKAWSKNTTLILGRDPDVNNPSGLPRSSWHLAVAIRLDDLLAKRHRVRFTEKTVTTFHAEKLGIHSAPLATTGKSI